MPTADSSAPKEVVTAALLVIGGKILSGRTKDQNIGYIAEYLTAVGIIAVGACGFPVSAADLFKVGFVFRDSVGEYGWTYQHELGRVVIECGSPCFVVRAENRVPTNGSSLALI